MPPSLLLLLASLVPFGFLVLAQIILPFIHAYLLPSAVKTVLREPGDGTEAAESTHRQSADWRSWTLATLGGLEMVLWSVGAVLVGLRGNAAWWEVLAVALGASSWVSCTPFAGSYDVPEY